MDRIDHEDGGNKILRKLNNKSHDVIAQHASGSSVPVPQNLSVKCSLLGFVSSIAFSYSFIEGLDLGAQILGTKVPWRLDLIVVATNTCEYFNICGTVSYRSAGAWNFEVVAQFLENLCAPEFRLSTGPPLKSSVKQ